MLSSTMKAQLPSTKTGILTSVRPRPCAVLTSSFCPALTSSRTIARLSHAACTSHSNSDPGRAEPCSILPGSFNPGPPSRASSRSSHRAVPCPSLQSGGERGRRCLHDYSFRTDGTDPVPGGLGAPRAAAHSLVVVATGSPGVQAQGDQNGTAATAQTEDHCDLDDTWLGSLGLRSWPRPDPASAPSRLFQAAETKKRTRTGRGATRTPTATPPCFHRLRVVG